MKNFYNSLAIFSHFLFEIFTYYCLEGFHDFLFKSRRELAMKSEMTDEIKLTKGF